MKLTLNSFFQAVRYALDVTSYDRVFLKVKQFKILETCMLRQHVIGVLPTGYGKSVIFHLLPYMWDYMCNDKRETSIVIVISPLNALIEDQVNSLKERGIKAGVLRTSRAEKINAANSQNDDSGSEDENEVSVVSEKKPNYCISSLNYSNVSRKENLSFYLLIQRLLYRVKMVEKSFSQIYTKIASHFVSLTKLT